jgi:hypothetical protein
MLASRNFAPRLPKCAIALLMIKRKEAPGGPGPLLGGKDTFARIVSNLQRNYEEKMNLIKDD